jgi:hypothetical protein
MRSDLRKRLEAIEQRHASRPTLVLEDDLLADDREVLEAEAMLDQAEAEMMADRGNPTLRSHWLDMARNLDAAKQRASDRRRGQLPSGSILVQYRRTTATATR